MNPIPDPLVSDDAALGRDVPSDFADMPPRMSPRMLAELLPDTSERSLERWRSLGSGPHYIKSSGTGKVYYLRSDVVAWMLGSRHHSTLHPAAPPKSSTRA